MKRIYDLFQLLRIEPFDTSTIEGRSKERYRRILLNSIGSILARFSLAALGLIIVPLILATYGKDLYGLWATITSTAMWFTLFDFGIVNSLVNAISEAYGKERDDLAANYFGTSFLFLAFSSLILVLILLAAVHIFPLDKIFSTEQMLELSSLRLLVLSATLPLVLALPFTLVKQIYAGYQRSYVSSGFIIFASLLTAFVVFLCIRGGANLTLVTALYIGIPGFIYLLNYLYLTKYELPWLGISRNNFSFDSLRRLLRISVPLFLFQLGALLVNQTQPLVLAHRAGLGVVADYTVIIRLHQAIMSVVLMSTIAFVPPLREASERGDWIWVRKNFFHMLRIRVLFAVLLGAVLILTGNRILGLWLGEDTISFELHVWLLVAVLMVASTWVTSYSDLLIVMDKIWPQVFLVIMNGLSIMVLTYSLAPQFGVLGALMGTTAFTLLITSWLIPSISRSVLQVGTR